MSKVNRKRDTGESSWVSFSDIMTGLMVIFMFIALSYMMEVKKKQQEVNKIVEEYRDVQAKIYKELDSTLTKRFEAYNIKVNPDLSIQITDADALFPVQFFNQDVYLMPRFMQFLDDFTPLFLGIILKPQYRNSISEIRIEGHTAIQEPSKEFEKDYYQQMLTLSQKRSNKVLEYMMNTSMYDELSENDKSYLRFITTSNGLAFGKALDAENHFKFLSGKMIDTRKSMRVEFRIITNSRQVVEEWMDKIK